MTWTRPEGPFVNTKNDIIEYYLFVALIIYVLDIINNYFLIDVATLTYLQSALDYYWKIGRGVCLEEIDACMHFCFCNTVESALCIHFES